MAGIDSESGVVNTGGAVSLTNVLAVANLPAIAGNYGIAIVRTGGGMGVYSWDGAAWVLVASGPAAGAISGGGTAGKIVKFTAGNVIGDSVLTELAGALTTPGAFSANSLSSVAGLQFINDGGSSLIAGNAFGGAIRQRTNGAVAANRDISLGYIDNSGVFNPLFNASAEDGLVATVIITGNVSGNAGTASVLQTARNINGVPFNGSANITITAAVPNALTMGTNLQLSAGTTFDGSAARTISLLAVLTGVTGIAPGANFVFTQNAVAAITFVEAGAIVNTIYVVGGKVGIQTTTPGLNHTVQGPFGLPLSSGAQTNGIFRLQDPISNISLDSGIVQNVGAWMQANNRANSAALPLYLNPNGGTVLIGSLAGTGNRLVQADPSGNLSATLAAPASGTYTPTLVARVGGATALTVLGFNYIRVGNQVMVTGRFTCTIGAGSQYVSATLPVASVFVAAANVTGTVSSHSLASVQPFVVEAAVGFGTNLIGIEFQMAGGGTVDMSISCMYSILP